MRPHESRDEKKTARASVSSYLILSGPWFALSVFYLYLLSIRGEFHGGIEVVLLCAAIGALWVAWLSGFLLEVDGGRFKYRDGFYRVKEIGVSEVNNAKNTWVEWSLLGRHLKVPRLLVSYGDKNEKIAINVKPFARTRYQDIFSVLKSSAARKLSH